MCLRSGTCNDDLSISTGEMLRAQCLRGEFLVCCHAFAEYWRQVISREYLPVYLNSALVIQEIMETDREQNGYVKLVYVRLKEEDIVLG